MIPECANVKNNNNNKWWCFWQCEIKTNFLFWVLQHSLCHFCLQISLHVLLWAVFVVINVWWIPSERSHGASCVISPAQNGGSAVQSVGVTASPIRPSVTYITTCVQTIPMLRWIDAARATVGNLNRRLRRKNIMNEKSRRRTVQWLCLEWNNRRNGRVILVHVQVPPPLPPQKK